MSSRDYIERNAFRFVPESQSSRSGEIETRRIKELLEQGYIIADDVIHMTVKAVIAGGSRYQEKYPFPAHRFPLWSEFINCYNYDGQTDPKIWVHKDDHAALRVWATTVYEAERSTIEKGNDMSAVAGLIFGRHK